MQDGPMDANWGWGSEGGRAEGERREARGCVWVVEEAEEVWGERGKW